MTDNPGTPAGSPGPSGGNPQPLGGNAANLLYEMLCVLPGVAHRPEVGTEQ